MVQNQASSAELKGSVRARDEKLGVWLMRGAGGTCGGVLSLLEYENI